MDRDADRARLVGNGAGDGLANPPRGVGRELVAALVLEFLDGLHQAHVAFLNEVEEREAAVGVLLGDGNDEAQVGFHHFALGLHRLLHPRFEFIVRLDESLGVHPRGQLELLQFALFVTKVGVQGGGLAQSLQPLDMEQCVVKFFTHLVGLLDKLLKHLLLEVKFLEQPL